MMMMMRDGGGQVTPWQLHEESSPAGLGYFLTDGYADAIAALQRYLPSNYENLGVEGESEVDRDGDLPIDAYSSDEFRMYEFKVRRCARARSHDWTDCPFAHPGEKARRRDPRKFHYSGTACPDFRKGHCKRADGCEYAHGVFECWLHPARYRTQPCKDGTACRRRVCFFAHTPEQLRVLSPRSAPGPAESYDGSPLRQSVEAYFAAKFGGSPTSTLIPPPVSSPVDSPPLSPSSPAMRRVAAPGGMNEVLTSLRQLQLNKAKTGPCSWVGGSGGRGFPSPRGVYGSLPGTPTAPLSSSPVAGGGWLDVWDRECVEEPMERVESGRGLRAKMFEKLAKANAVETAGGDPSPSEVDVGWVSELVK